VTDKIREALVKVAREWLAAAWEREGVPGN